MNAVKCLAKCKHQKALTLYVWKYNLFRDIFRFTKKKKKKTCLDSIESTQLLFTQFPLMLTVSIISSREEINIGVFLATKLQTLFSFYSALHQTSTYFYEHELIFFYFTQ